MRTINMTVTGDLVTVNATVVGVQGSGNADTIRLTLDEAWDGWAKTAVWWNAHGREGYSRTITADLLEDIAVSSRCYLLPVPPEALEYGGPCTLVLDGYADGRRARTVEQVFEVARAKPRKAVAEGESVTSPTETEQMQAQVDALLGTLGQVCNGEADRENAEAERVKAENARKAAEQARADAETGRVSKTEGVVARAAEEAARAERNAGTAQEEASRAKKEADRAERAAQGVLVDIESGVFAMCLNEEGHLILAVNVLDTAPPLRIEAETGHLIYEITT